MVRTLERSAYIHRYKVARHALKYNLRLAASEFRSWLLFTVFPVSGEFCPVAT